MREVIDLPGPGIFQTPLKVDDYMTVAGQLMANGLINVIPAFSDFFESCAAVHEK